MFGTRMKESRLVWRWWDRDSLVVIAVVLLIVAGWMFVALEGTGVPTHRYWWGLLALLIAGAIGIRVGRVEKDQPTRGRIEVALGFLVSSRTWLVVAILATVYLGMGIVLGFNRPWDPLQPCARTALTLKYTDEKCLARASRGRLVPWETGVGDEYVFDSGRLDESTLELIEPSAEPYTWRWRPVTGFLLTVAAVGGFGLYVWLRSVERR